MSIEKVLYQCICSHNGDRVAPPSMIISVAPNPALCKASRADLMDGRG